MGPELALALAAGGTGVSMLGQQQARDEQRSILNRQLARTNQTQSNVTNEVMNEAKKYTPDARMADMQANESRVLGQSQKDLGAASPVAGAGAAGARSADYARSKAVSDAMEGDRLSAIAREAAKTRAPGAMMVGEGLRRADLTGDVAHQWGADRNMANAAQLDASNVQEPWWGQLGKIAQTVGMGAALGGAGGLAAGAAAPYTTAAADSALVGGTPASVMGTVPGAIDLGGAGGLGSMSTGWDASPGWLGGGGGAGGGVAAAPKRPWWMGGR